MNFLVSHDQFDSDILKRKVAKVKLPENHSPKKNYDEDVKKLVHELSDYDYATLRFSAYDYALTHALEENGFLLVDSTIEMSAVLPIELHKDKNIRESESGDKDAILDIASSIFMHNRFFNDPKISKAEAQTIYKTWTENCLKGETADKVYVYEEGSEILGYLAIKNNGHIELIGVSKKAQGKGVGKKLTQFALHRFTDIGLDTAELETQATNIPAIRVYASCGYKMTGLSHTYRLSK